MTKTTVEEQAIGNKPAREDVPFTTISGRPIEPLYKPADSASVDYARCRAVYFAPWNEDYGFVTLEAFRSGKGVITTPDSGGPAELVEHDSSGIVALPTAEGIAEGLDRIATDRGLAERLGEGGRVSAARFLWPATVEALLR